MGVYRYFRSQQDYFLPLLQQIRQDVLKLSFVGFLSSGLVDLPRARRRCGPLRCMTLSINFARTGLTDLMLMQVCWQGWSDFKIMIEQVLEKAP